MIEQPDFFTPPKRPNPNEESSHLTGSKQTDPYSVIESAGGYDSRTFHVNRGVEDEAPKVISVKLHPHVWTLVMAKVVNDPKFPEIKSIHDVVNDSIWHRLMFLLREYDSGLRESDVAWIETAAINDRIEQDHSRNRQMDAFFHRAVEAIRTAQNSGMPERIELMIQHVKDIAQTVSPMYVPRLQVLIEEAEQTAASIREEEYRELLREYPEEGGGKVRWGKFDSLKKYDPYGVTEED